MAKISKPEYEEKVKKLSREGIERLLSRMTGKLPHRLEKEKLSRDEALAIQMELEDEQLQEWRRMMAILNKKAAVKTKEKTKEKSAKGADKPKKTPATVTVKKAVPKAATAKRQATVQPKAKPAAGKPAAK